MAFFRESFCLLVVCAYLQRADASSKPSSAQPVPVKTASVSPTMKLKCQKQANCTAVYNYFIFDDVCGNNGQKYPDDCYAAEAACKDKKLTEVSAIYNDQGDSGCTYKTVANLKSELRKDNADRKAKNVKDKFNRGPVIIPDNLTGTEIWGCLTTSVSDCLRNSRRIRSYCGDDGVVYRNYCELGAAACNKDGPRYASNYWDPVLVGNTKPAQCKIVPRFVDNNNGADSAGMTVTAATVTSVMRSVTQSISRNVFCRTCLAS